MPCGEAGAEIVIVVDGPRDVKIEILSFGIASADYEAIFSDFADVGDIFAAERNLPR